MFGLPVDAVRRILAFETEARLQRAMQARLGAVRGIFIKAQSNLMRQLRALPRDPSAARKRGRDQPPTWRYQPAVAGSLSGPTTTLAGQVTCGGK
jgi:hypothetical protein